MSALSDRIKKTIQSVFDLPRKDIEVRVDAIVAATRQGRSQGQQVKDILQTIEDAETAVKTVDGVEDVNVEMVFDPPWDMSLMSDEARLTLNMF